MSATRMNTWSCMLLCRAAGRNPRGACLEEDLRLVLQVVPLASHRAARRLPMPTGAKSRHGTSRKSSKKSTSGKGSQSSHSSSSRHYLMPGYTGHVPGITTMEPGLSYLERTGQFLDRADHRDRIHHVVPRPADNPPAVAMVRAALAKHSRKQKHSKSHRHAQKEAKTAAAHRSVDTTTAKGQKSAPPSASKTPTNRYSSTPVAKMAEGDITSTVKLPPANPHQTPPGSLAIHVSPTPGYTGHIPRQFDLNPGMTFGKQTSFLQTGTWNSEESFASLPSSSSQHKPSGYTGHLPGAVHLAPGLSYSKVSKVIQRQLSPAKVGSRTSTSESIRQQSQDTTRSANFYNSVPAGYSGHIPGIVHLEPGKNYLRQAAEFMETSSNPSHQTVTVLSSPSHTTHIPCTQFPSGYSGHIPGAHLLEPGLSYAAQTKIIESRLQEAAGHPSRERTPSRPSSKAHPQISKPPSQVGKREAQSETGSRVGSKASMRDHTPASATHKSSLSSMKHSSLVYTDKGNLPGYTGHVPNSTDYHGLTFGDMTKGFGKQHQSKVPDELVKDLRVRMPG